MAHIRVLQVIKGDKKEGDSLKLLPGTFKSDAHAQSSIKETGEYLFLETHSITIKKGKNNGHASDTAQQEEE